MPPDWDLLTTAFLHDPPDKALDIRGHERRAVRYLEAALGRSVDAAGVKQDAGLADRLAAIAERLPMPTAGRDGERAVSVRDGLQLNHPLGGVTTSIEAPLIDEDAIAQQISEIVAGIDEGRSRHLALWRLLPERLTTRLHPVYALLPADTRVPDHTIWHHADTAVALVPADSGAGAAFVSFAIAPVQGFIAAARSLRDLWSGSLILSYLAFQALLPIVNEVGPAALVFPYLRGNPLLDRWLRDQPGLRVKIDPPGAEACSAPSLPNRFLAVVPATSASGLARRSEEAARAAWRELAEAVRNRLGHEVPGEFSGWDRFWGDQIEQYWEIRSAAMPLREMSDADLARLSGGTNFADVWEDAARVREMATHIPPQDRPAYDQQSAGRWQAMVDLAARALEARRSIRHVPRTLGSASGAVPQKCALLGTVERMGPPEFQTNRAFWETLRRVNLRGVQLRQREAFSAIALTKRFALPVKLGAELGIDEYRLADTATVAARPWLAATGLGAIANGQWLFWRRRDQEPEEEPIPEPLWKRICETRSGHGRPPAYLAILVMDGDHMGAWLRGEKSPKLDTVIHPKMCEYFRGHGAQRILERTRRPVGPALHAAISEALTNFATRVAPGIVNDHCGELVYAGGDDLLALLPTTEAVACAAALQGAFRGLGDANRGAIAEGYYRCSDGLDRPVMGPRATLSAGIAVVHHKEDLRVALGLARQAENTAKRDGRDRLHLFIARRSGEHAGETIFWPECAAMTDAVAAFTAGASDRWTYRLRKLLPALPPEPEAFDLELKRQLGRSDKDTRTALVGLVEGRAFRTNGRPAENVVALWQAASFLARGRDEGGED